MDTSYLTSQVATIIGQLHGLFDEIGVPSHERESRESELFTALSEALHNQLRLVASEKTELTGEANRIITHIKQMETSLDDAKETDTYAAEDDSLRVSYPLMKCVQRLKEKHTSISRVHKERYEQVKKLVQALESYSSHLETSFVKIALPPSQSHASVPPSFDLSPRYVAALDQEFTRVYEEYTRRVATVQAISEEIIKLWAELGTPQAQTDSIIVKFYRDSPEQLGLHEDDLARLKSKKEKLLEEKKARERKLKELRTTVEALWDRLGVEEQERKGFLSSNRGCGVRVINEFEDELNRLSELKRQNLHLFVEDARFRLQTLWDDLFFSEEEMLEFTPAFSDVCSDALLSAHESEIARLTALKTQRLPTITLISRHRTLVTERDDLAASSQDVSRLMMRGQRGEKRDPTRLLREEKMRKRIAKELPKVEAELRNMLESWEDEYGRPFLVCGERYLDEIERMQVQKAPGRSKTPNGLPPRPQSSMAGTTRVPTKPGHTVSLSTSSVRETAPLSRAGTKTPTGSVRGQNPFAIKAVSAAQQTGSRTPSRIPARAPLSNMRNGNNSPERRHLPATTHQVPLIDRSHAAPVNKMLPPSHPQPSAIMAPPPRMRALQPQATPTPHYSRSYDPTPNHSRPPSHASSSASSNMSTVIRHISPSGDVYDEHQRTPQSYRDLAPQPQARAYAHPAPVASTRYDPNACYAMESRMGDRMGERQFSHTSASTATASGSGSENWETFDEDEGRRETDLGSVTSAGGASEWGEYEEYVAKYGIAGGAAGKRPLPEVGQERGGPGMQALKRARGLGEAPEGKVEILQDRGGAGGLLKVSGSEAGWTDVDAF